MPTTAESRYADTIFKPRNRKKEHVFSDDSQETLKDSSTSTNSKTRSIGDASPSEDISPPPKRRLRKPRGKVTINYQESSEVELDHRHTSEAAHRPLRCHDNSPVFRITPDADPPPPKPTRLARKPKIIDLRKKPNRNRNEKNTKTKQAPRERQTRSSYNFSDFDDYSLIVSEGSGRAGLGSDNSGSRSSPFRGSKIDDVNGDVAGDVSDDVFDRLEPGRATITYESTPQRVQTLGTSTPQRVQNLETSTPQRVQNLETSTPQRVQHLETSTPQRVQNLETSTPQRVQNLESGLEALSLSIIELRSPDGGTDDVTPSKSDPPIRSASSRKANAHNSHHNNSSLFHVSLESIAESDHEHSDDLFDSPGLPRRRGTRGRSHDNVSSVVSRLESVVEEAGNLVSDDERENSSNDSDKENEAGIAGTAGTVEMDPAETQPSYLTSPSTPLRNDKKTKSTRKSCLPELDQFTNSLKILTPLKLAGTCRVVSPRSKLLHQCDQPEFVRFDDCFTGSQLSGCKKIGEGVYGEVFSLLSVSKQPLAVKIIPIEGDQLVNEEPQKSFEEILPEIVISRELSSLRDCDVNWTDNFVHLHRTTCVRGRYPDKLLAEWNEYNDKKGSENDSPEMFDEDQLFLILEFTNGGEDLETYKFSTVNQALSVVHQVTLALAVSERELMFEHRDLHLGNILISKTKEKTISYVLDTEEININSHGVKICIIDFTLSRLTKDECTVYLDIGKDETLFQGQGDTQFEVYRKMRDNNGDVWETFEPITNVYWISFLAEKLAKYKFAKKSPKLLRELRHFNRNLSGYDSAYSVAVNELQ